MNSKPKGREPFTISRPTFDTDEISAAIFRQELNELKIEKLANRVTIISVIIPCLICAILFFSYMDIKERMVSVHDTGQTEVQGVAEELGTKINAMTVGIAGIQHKFETALPDVDKKIENLESAIAKLATTKAEKSDTKAELTKMEKTISDRQAQTNQAMTKALETMKAETSKSIEKAVEKEKSLVDKTSKLENLILDLTKDIKAEKNTIGALATRIKEEEETMAFLQKELSLVKIKADTLEQTTVDRKVLDRELDLIKKQYKGKAAPLVKPAAVSAPVPATRAPGPRPPEERKPAPAKPAVPDGISEKDLLQ